MILHFLTLLSLSFSSHALTVQAISIEKFQVFAVLHAEPQSLVGVSDVSSGKATFALCKNTPDQAVAFSDCETLSDRWVEYSPVNMHRLAFLFEHDLKAAQILQEQSADPVDLAGAFTLGTHVGIFSAFGVKSFGLGVLIAIETYGRNSAPPVDLDRFLQLTEFNPGSLHFIEYKNPEALRFSSIVDSLMLALAQLAKI